MIFQVFIRFLSTAFSCGTTEGIHICCIFLFLLLLLLWFKESRSCVLTPAWSNLETVVATNRSNGSSQRTHPIYKDSCNSSVLFLCHTAVCELSPPHPGQGFVCWGRVWVWVDLSGLRAWLLWAVLGHLAWSFTPFLVFQGIFSGSCVREFLGWIIFNRNSYSVSPKGTESKLSTRQLVKVVRIYA